MSIGVCLLVGRSNGHP